jgi:hypothetical protein
MRCARAMLCAVFSANVVLAINVETFEQFEQALLDQENNITLTESFAFSSTLRVLHSCTIQASKPVTLDLQGNSLLIRTSSVVMGSFDHAIHLINGNQNLILSSCCSDITDVTFINCHFDWSQADNGVSIRVRHALEASFLLCHASYNQHDGFNMSNWSDGYGEALITLDQCQAVENDRTGSGLPGAGDGVTAHSSNHTCTVIGGQYSNNGKCGAAFVGGSRLYVQDGSRFIDNGWSPLAINEDVYIGDNGMLYWDDGHCETLFSMEHSKYAVEVSVTSRSSLAL